MGAQELTNKQRWDTSWEKIKLPLEVKRSKRAVKQNALIDIVKAYFPVGEQHSILEIGGAPGQYLAFMARNYSYKIHALDYSDIGCEKIIENFQLLGLDGKVYHLDLMSDDLSAVPQFDIVYSLGVIEHFVNVEKIIEKHLLVLKPGGLLMIGLPNLLGINYWLMKKLAPEKLSQHNLKTMDLKNWTGFETQFGLEIIFKSYIGGIEPYYKFEKKTISNQVVNFVVRGIRVFILRLNFLRNFNSRYWSSYIVGIYRKPK